MENYLRIGKAHFNIITASSMYVSITKTKGIKPYTVSLIVNLQYSFIRLLVFQGCISKVI
jgi:hypothetical protein